MAFRDVINKWLGKDVPPPQTTDTGYTAKAIQTLGQIQELWKVYDDRKSVWGDIERMDGEDEIVSGSLDVVAGRTTAFHDLDDKDGFYIESPSSEVKQVLTEFTHRTKLDQQSWDITRATAKHGSHFVEPVVTPAGDMFQISYIKQFPRAYEISRNEDAYGRLRDENPVDAMKSNTKGIAAYDQMNDYRELIACFYSWQIVHFKYGKEQGLTYPIPYFFSARKNWKRLQILEDGMAMARLIRAYTKLSHEILMPTGLTDKRQKELVDQYKQQIIKRNVSGWDSSNNKILNNVESPYSVDTDFFLPAYYTQDDAGRISKISSELKPLDVSNPQLQNLTDIRYSLNRLISRTKVPAKYLNFDIGQARFSEQGMGPEEEQFGIELKKIQMAHKHGVRQLCDLELQLHGIPPQEYTIVMPEISIRNQSRRAQVEESYARAGSMWAGALQNAGQPVPWDFIAQNYMRLRGEELQKFIKQVQAQAAETYDRVGENGVGDCRKIDLSELFASTPDCEFETSMKALGSEIMNKMEFLESLIREKD